MENQTFSTPFQLPIQLASCQLWLDSKFETEPEVEKNLHEKVQQEPIKLAHIPAMQKRRMSTLSKMALETSHRSLLSVNIEPHQVVSVFASQHGELKRTMIIIQGINRSEEVSPTDFSHSVHNTASGLFSIHHQNKLPATSIAAGEDSLGFALLESFNLIQRFQQPILLTAFDEPLPEPLDQLKRCSNIQQIAHSFSMIIPPSAYASHGADLSLNISFVSQKSEQKRKPFALELFAFLHSEKISTMIQTENRIWKIEKNV